MNDTSSLQQGVRAPVLASSLIVLSLACGGGFSAGGPDVRDDSASPPGPVASVIITPGAATLTSLREPLALTAEAKDAEGLAIAESAFEWTTSTPPSSP